MRDMYTRKFGDKELTISLGQDMHLIALHIDIQTAETGIRGFALGIHAWAVLVCCGTGYWADDSESPF